MSAQAAGDEFFIERTFDAPAATMFALWTNPEHFRRWIGPTGFACPDLAMDCRVGGHYRARIRSDERAADWWFGGRYREIEPNRRLVFTFVWDNNGPSHGIETVVTLTFEERDGRTIQTFHHRPFPDDERRETHRNGWTDTFGKLAAYAEAVATTRIA